MMVEGEGSCLTSIQLYYITDFYCVGNSKSSHSVISERKFPLANKIGNYETTQPRQMDAAAVAATTAAAAAADDDDDADDASPISAC